MMKGCIAIPDVDPKSWRSRGRKKRTQPALASAIVAPPPLKKRRGPAIRLGEEVSKDTTLPPIRSAIVEPKRKPTLIFGPAPDDYDPEAHRRAGEKADELFREIVRRVAKRD